MPGAKPLPIEELKRRGTYNVTRHSHSIEVARGAPLQPDSLSEGAIPVWDHFVKLFADRLSPQDGDFLARLCETKVTLANLQKIVTTEGPIVTITTEFGETPREHPALRAMATYGRIYTQLLAEFGASPSSRMKVPKLNDKVKSKYSAVQELQSA